VSSLIWFRDAKGIIVAITQSEEEKKLQSLGMKPTNEKQLRGRVEDVVK